MMRERREYNMAELRLDNAFIFKTQNSLVYSEAPFIVWIIHSEQHYTRIFF